MLIGSIFFAVMGLLTESLGDEYSFAWIAAIRSAIATLLAMLMVWLGGARFVVFKPATLWMRSLAGCCAMLCIFYAMTHYDVAIILSMSSMYPIWVAVLGWPLLGQLPSRDTWIALVVSTAGMLLVYASATGKSIGIEGHAHYLPQIAIPVAGLGAMLSGVALIGLHKVKEVDARAVVAHFSAVSTILSFLLWTSLPAAKMGSATDPTSLPRLLGVGVTAMLGQLFLTKAFSAGRPARISVVGLSQVAVAASYKWVVEGRIPAPLAVIGMLMVIASTIWVMLRQETE